MAPTGPYKSRYSGRHETRTVRDGADAVHLREPGGVQPVGKRRPSAARSASSLDDDAAREALLDAAPALHADQRHARRCATRSPRMYPGATADHIQVTNGGSEANYITTWNLVEPGDEVVMMVPNYMQTWGLARAFGATVATGRWSTTGAAAAGASTSTRSSAGVAADEADRHLQPEQPDRRAVRGRAISTASRRSPTGTARGSCPTRSIAAPSSTAGRRRRCGAGHERVIVTSGLSKAYGLPGLRIGWIVGAAAARRVAVVVSRLHDDRARRAQRRAGAARARAGAARRRSWRARAAS